MKTGTKILIGVGFFFWLTRKKGNNVSLGALHPTRFVPVYKELPSYENGYRGKTNIAWARGLTGVYIIKRDGKIIYVGDADGLLYKTAIRHFQKWNDTEYKKRISYKDTLDDYRYTIRLVVTNTAEQAHKLEQALIKKYDPEDNRIKYINIIFWLFAMEQEGFGGKHRKWRQYSNWG